MIYYRALRDVRFSKTGHRVAEDEILTVREYRKWSGYDQVTKSCEALPRVAECFEMIDIPKYYVYFLNGKRYAYAGAEEVYNDFISRDV